MHFSERVWRERGLRDAALAGDGAAWCALYEGAFAGLDAYALWRCGGLRDRADDVVQDTWLTAVRRLRVFEPERGDFPSWLRGIAANLLRNLFRRERRRGPIQSLNGAASPAVDGTADRERAERVAVALASLPDHYEAALRAKYLDGRAVADIAADTGATEKAVESLLTRARQAFREAYAQSE
jgi:RNA polymerase sigma-70 factor (ECF subfamily)